MRKVIVVRGIPGSGKTHYVRAAVDAYARAGLRFKVVSVSANDHFVDADGKYCFDPMQLGAAHAACYRKFLDALHDARVETIIVDNTNLQAWEISPYMLAASAYGVDAEVVNVVCDTGLAFARQLHNVSRQTHDRMANDFYSVSLPPFWQISTVLSARCEHKTG